MTYAKMQIIAKAFSIWLVFQVLLLAGTVMTVNIPMWALAIATGTLLSLIMAYLTSLYLRSDGQSFRDIGMALSPGSFKRAVVSLIVGMMFFGAFYIVYLLLTPVTLVAVSQPDLFQATVISLLVFVVLGAMEEIVFRGYFLRKLEAGIGIRGAIYVTSIAFGLYHGISTESLTGPAVWGLLYAVLAYWTNGLAVPLGFHIGANFIQALLSGKQDRVSGFWYFDMHEAPALFTVDQVSVGLRIFLFVLGIALVEYYLRVVRPGQQQKE